MHAHQVETAVQHASDRDELLNKKCMHSMRIFQHRHTFATAHLMGTSPLDWHWSLSPPYHVPSRVLSRILTLGRKLRTWRGSWSDMSAMHAVNSTMDC